MSYNYKEALKQDIRNELNYQIETKECTIEEILDPGNREDFIRDLSDLDWITGNHEGYCGDNRDDEKKYQEYIYENIVLLKEAMDWFGQEHTYDPKDEFYNANAWDCRIRCMLLPECFDKVAMEFQTITKQYVLSEEEFDVIDKLQQLSQSPLMISQDENGDFILDIEEQERYELAEGLQMFLDDTIIPNWKELSQTDIHSLLSLTKKLCLPIHKEIEDRHEEDLFIMAEKFSDEIETDDLRKIIDHLNWQLNDRERQQLETLINDHVLKNGIEPAGDAGFVVYRSQENDETRTSYIVGYPIPEDDQWHYTKLTIGAFDAFPLQEDWEPSDEFKANIEEMILEELEKQNVEVQE